MNSEEISHLSTPMLFHFFNCDPSRGLSHEDVVSSQNRLGKNEFEDKREPHPCMKYIKHFTEPMIILLLISSFVSLVLGHYDDAISIAVAIVIVVSVSFVQEYRSEKSLNSLKKLVPMTCRCLREGNVAVTEAKELVPGDIILLDIGDRVPADIRIFEAINLFADESGFSGESEPQPKVVDGFGKLSSNLAFMGTYIVSGHGKGVVVSTGSRTQFGEVFELMRDQEPPPSPLEKNMFILGKHLTIFSFVVIALIMITALLQGKQLLRVLTTAVSLAVAAIPEGLPIVVTVTLAIAIIRIARQRCIVKRMSTLDTLGCVNVCCCDKTGTLTKNEMTVTAIITSNGEHFSVSGVGYLDGGVVSHRDQPIFHGNALSVSVLLESAGLCSNTPSFDDSHVPNGQPTELAIMKCLHKFRMGDPRFSKFERLNEWPFSSETKTMAVLCQNNGEQIFFSKGAYEKIIDGCAFYFDADRGSCRHISEVDRQQIISEARGLALQGLRVIGVSRGSSLSEMTYLGLLGLMDPPREGIAKSIEVLQKAGICIKMVTGDSMETALSIATKLNIRLPNDRCISGDEVESLDSLELSCCSVFYRTTPKQKLMIVKTLRAGGNTVMMSGDGVNDAAALKCADVGICMGMTGTDTCREAADIILARDEFSAVESAVAEGRSIIGNIRNFVKFQLSTSLAALTITALSTLANLPNPLNAMQILWINIIMDGPPAQSVGVEPCDFDAMSSLPRFPNVPIINSKLIIDICFAAVIITIGVFSLFYHQMVLHSDSPARYSTQAFTCFVFFDMFNALSCRSIEKSIFSIGFFTNRAFVVAVSLSIIGQLLVIYFPPLQRVFQTEALSFPELLKILAISSSLFLFFELKKYVSRRKFIFMHYSKQTDIII